MCKFLLGFVLASIANSAPIRWQENGHLYDLLPATSNWEFANQSAQSRGGYLVSILSQEEQDFLNAQYGVFEDLWIGLNDRAAPGTPEWTSGEPVSYTNFGAGQPDNGGCPITQRCEDVSHMNAFNAGGWNDLTNGMLTLRGVVEFDIPEPSTLLLVTAALAALLPRRTVTTDRRAL